MKIKEITLVNVGPYCGHNKFDIYCEDKTKNIILVGGKNGAGKTTFFTSLRICLYGCKAYGYDNNNAYYLNEVYKLINDFEKEKKLGTAKVELLLLFDDGMDNLEYRICRQWECSNSKVSEEYHVYLNDNEIVGDKLYDFENYLLHIISPNLFKFYFFDGEKISEFFLQNNNDNSFKNAFLTMTGYDNIELLISNLKRNISSKTKNSVISNKYFQIVDEINSLQNELSLNKQKDKEYVQSLIAVEDSISKIEQEYMRSGGVSDEKWQSINKEILAQDVAREEFHRQRKDLVNTEIPYLILKDKLEDLAKQIEAEDIIKKENIIKEYINADTLNKILFDLDVQNRVKVVNTICEYIERNIDQSKLETLYLDLSNKEKNEILLQIDEHFGFDKNVVLDLSNKIKSSLSYSQKLKNSLLKLNVDRYQEFLALTKDLQAKKNKIEEEKRLNEIAITNLELMLQNKEVEFKRIKKEYEDELKSLSVTDISSRALLAFDNISSVLLRKQIDKVEKNFKKIFPIMINKKNFLDGIYIDEKLNIFPYRNVKVPKAQIPLLKQLKSDNSLLKRKIEIIDSHITDDKDYIVLPEEVTSSFSQGEKQIYIMCIYFALMQISKIEVPFVIDTPFARIDATHRKNIVNNFFTKLKGQVFILSTDEEINDKYMNDISDKVSNKYLLQYISRGKTSILKDQYFGGSEL